MSEFLCARRSEASKDITADILPPPLYLIELRPMVSEALEGTKTLDEATATFDRLTNEYRQRVKYWENNEAYGLESDLLGAQHEAANRFIESVRPLIGSPLLAGQRELALANLPKLHSLCEVHRDGVDATARNSLAFADVEMTAFNQASRTQTQADGNTLLVVSAALAIAFGWLTRHIWRTVGAEPEQLALAAGAVAGGDLSQAIKTDMPGSVATSMEAMRERLRSLVKATNESADQVVMASSQIASGNIDLSERTPKLAHRVQEFHDQ